MDYTYFVRNLHLIADINLRKRIPIEAPSKPTKTIEGITSPAAAIFSVIEWPDTTGINKYGMLIVGAIHIEANNRSVKSPYSKDNIINPKGT
ncbi:hypothetical protein H8790_03150 [Oscillibacter hominis]|uniref:Uncharacterized protein n=1 Tax=Oscillibacter hominis TaxID=2763056 RepID=A0A7G9B669_9FIRM|nr:hypothetical protein [Oscillibacter hominis]QNL45050.1 hypothetical protein H8790_03150 [Oscillibacter hominis]